MSMLNNNALKGTVKINAEAFSEPRREAAIKYAVVAKAIAPTEIERRFNQKLNPIVNTVNNAVASTKNNERPALIRYSQKL